MFQLHSTKSAAIVIGLGLGLAGVLSDTTSAQGLLRSFDVESALRATVGEQLTLRVDQDRTYHITQTHDGASSEVLIGSRADGLGRLVIARHQDVVAGYLLGAGGTWHLRGTRGAIGTIERAADGFDCQVPNDVGLAQAPGTPPGTAVAGGGCDGPGTVHDVLVLYTSSVEAFWGGEAATLAEIDAVIAVSNLALADSATAPQLRLVLSWLLPAGETVSLQNLTNPFDGVADEVHTLRDMVAADQVVLLYNGSGGVANGLWVLDPSQAGNAFNRSGVISFPYVFPHEIGHNMGCCHAFGDGGGCPAQGGLLFPYSNGHRWFGNSGTEWRTIMAYSPGERIGRFSNPNLSFDGVPTGTANADNALTINQSQALVAAFRCADDAVCGDLSDPLARADCNGNGFPDGCDIGSGLSTDANGNGVPDSCETACDADCGDGNGTVDTIDFLALLSQWGEVGSACDFDGNGVDTVDFLALLATWGDCP